MFGFFARRRRRKIAETPFPDAWRDVLERRVAYYRRLPPELRAELETDVAIFVAEKTFEGCGGLEMTDEIRVVIAAEACVLLLGLDHEYYPGLDVIRVYPSAFVVPSGEVRLGESWRRGVVVLAWDRVAGTAGEDGHNVVFHEFAHQLDQEDGPIDGAPALPDIRRYQAWAQVLGEEYAELADALQQDRPTLIDEYGSKSPAEFFAVVTELFFERPKALRKRHPELYEQLRQFYGQDPAAL
jgi:Mlc titration factor MtfA (ptsG expression regulator)